jgi:hypothetical protein
MEGEPGVERQQVRRRVAVALVAVVAATATIATSPAPNQSTLETSADASVTLTDSSPRGVGRFVLDLPAETLPVGTGAAPAPSGTANFAVVNATGVDGTGQPVALNASVVGIPVPPTTTSGAASWPVEQLCSVGEPCHREFDVTVEWLHPESGKSITATVEASLRLDFQQRQSAPPGATATWAAGEFSAEAPRPAVKATVDLGNLTLGRESPLAVRHLQLTGSSAMLAASLGADITAYVRSEPSGEQLRSAIVSIVADPAAAVDGPAPAGSPLPDGAFISPFGDCQLAADCTRGFTVFARWIGPAPDDQVDLQWSFDAVARFPVGTQIPEAATLTAEMEDRIDLGSGSARLDGKAEGSFEVTTNGNVAAGALALSVRAPAIRGAYLGADVPAIAILTLRAAVKDPGNQAGLRFRVSTAAPTPWHEFDLPGDGTEVRTVVFPLAGCRNLGECAGSLVVNIDGPAGRDATISWQVTVDLPVPRPALATGAIRIDLVNAP